MGEIKSFRDLRVWQKGIELVKELYKITDGFPSNEQYGLQSQMRRAAVSIPSNIAEGFRRRHAKEHKQFLNVALGSCAELETQVVIAKELNYISNDQEARLMDLIDFICRMTTNLYKKL